MLSIAMSMSVCLSVCLLYSAHISLTRKPHGRSSPNFYTLPVAVSRSSSDGVAICYALPVLWITSCFYIMVLWRVMRCVFLIVLSHWPHVAEQVWQQVAAHVASVKGLVHKLPNLLLNLCPSPFTLATCAATSLRGA